MKVSIFSLLLIFPLLLIGQLPADFSDQKHPASFNFPVGLTFDETGRAFVWEKAGKVYIIDTMGNKLPEPLIDISEEVTNWKDHGLMGFTLDQAFLQNGRFYLYYAVDLHHFYHFGTPQYHPDSMIDWEATIGRVTRYQADVASGFTRTLPNSRKVLLGETLDNGIPLTFEFHGIGSLVTGTDGTLMLSSGDATSSKDADTGGDMFGTFYSDALKKGILTPDQNLGSYRSQYLGSYNGKILRIDPESGDGLPSNPYYDAANPRSPASRIWSVGFRNPYRIVVRPESGSHYSADGSPGQIVVGDVGTGLWEELNIVTKGGQNFGWPIMEGHYWSGGFTNKEAPPNPLAPNPLFSTSNGCKHEFFNFRELMPWPKPGEELPTMANPCNASALIPKSDHFTVTSPPVIAWSNSRWNPPIRTVVSGFSENNNLTGVQISNPEVAVESEEFGGFSSLAGVFYTSDLFPEKYHGKYFGFDHEGWIKVFTFNDDNAVVHIETFHEFARNIIHLALNPADGSLYYTNMQNEVRKITYGGNPPPVAVIEVDKHFGSASLTVRFDGTRSYDPNANIAGYQWDFGDGTTSTLPQPEHTFQASGTDPQTFKVRLTVTDSLGASASTSQLVSLNNTPPVARITSFEDGDLYPMDKTVVLQLAADVSDAEHATELLTYSWEAFLHHNDHFHPEPAASTPLSYTLISPLGCNRDEYWYRVELTVTDPEGLSTTDSRNIYPACGISESASVELGTTGFENYIELSWEKKGSHEDVLSYEIQRTADFFHFQTIGTIAPDELTLAEFRDLSPEKGVNIYRIKTVRASRAFNYSNLATADFPPLAEINLFPNPASDQVELVLKEALTDRVTLEVFTAAGQRLFHIQMDGKPGQRFRQTISTTSLNNGTYFYRVIDGENAQAGTLLIMK